ncbi:hypothetical protein AXK56_16705 [Tsukamurella pulmonis]|uniref:hypothetical protein n=1 Tax=Tsukamurella pulmonis TaxID=47312 RepID=UPI000795E0AA|nr:hypothetical protein [Tsukamurella pulmonis]KXO95850.1 hypothetical protein AXK56_16705 [Tsukamurella pulmonis]
MINRTAVDLVNLDANGQYAPGVERYLTEGAIADLRERTNGPRSSRRLRMFVDGEEVSPGKLSTVPQVGDIVWNLSLIEGRTPLGRVVAIEDTDTERIVRLVRVGEVGDE